jgi:glyoxylase-like metal-dependent hydrolase (beta-lactamase superfamily II)
MKLYALDSGTFRLDGGAMFGVVPKTIWQKTNPPDDNNLILMAMRCLLIESDKRLILIDAGIGHKYNTKFQQLYQIDHRFTLEASLIAAGFEPSEVTDVVLTHLHFDHCGGATKHDESGRLTLTFPLARHWVQRSHLEWALQPNAREKASFFSENILPLVDSGLLETLDGPTELIPGLELVTVHGHTEGQQLPLITFKDYKLLYAADLFPTFGHLPLPYVMGYDTRPLLTLDERSYWLKRIVAEDIVLFYEHDPHNQCGRVGRNDQGKYYSLETFPLTNITA